jgi:hypothetical protein
MRARAAHRTNAAQSTVDSAAAVRAVASVFVDRTAADHKRRAGSDRRQRPQIAIGELSPRSCPFRAVRENRNVDVFAQ